MENDRCNYVTRAQVFFFAGLFWFQIRIISPTLELCVHETGPGEGRQWIIYRRQKGAGGSMFVNILF